ncbi:MAG TPA: MFS transporter [Candidatus Limnocylindria bacterium]|jgi:FSR family fosmidomycin resistance protein-like MFS transporter|nr:MFS transporter [Candidatus Limnocylindria bacterium]
MTTIAEETMAVAAEAPIEELSLKERRGQALLGTITAAHFSHHVTNSLLNPLLPSIRDAFALSYAESGFAVSAFSIAAGLANAPWGILADRVGSRVVIVGGLFLMGAASVALATAGAYWQLLALLVLLGIVSGSYHGPAAALIARTYSPRVRGTAMGLHITGGHLSFFAAPALAGVLVMSTGTWRTPYIWFAAAPIVFGALLWLVAPHMRERAAPGDRFAAFREIGRVFRDVGPVVSLSIGFQFGIAALLAFLALYFVDVRGLSPALAAVFFGVPQLVGVVGAPLGGWLSDRLGRRRVMLGGLALMGPAVFALTVVPNEALLLTLVVFGLLWSMRSTVTETLVMDSAPAGRRATVLGAYYLVNAHVGGIGAPLFGFLAEGVGLATAFSWIGVAFVAMSALALLIGRRL